MSKREDPYHPILDRPWTWHIVGLRFAIPQDGSEPFIDLELERTGELRQLRFWSPQDLAIKKGFPSAPGLVILDVSNRGLDRLSVRVDDDEAGGGGIHFWARTVQDVTSPG